MKLERFPVPALGQVSYLLSSGRDAVAVDPIRDCGALLEAARRDGLRIRHVLLTHLPEDYIGGHLEVSRWMGGEVALSPAGDPQFAHRALEDEATIRLGSLRIQALATPGHSPDSMCFHVTDSEGGGEMLFSGDTLLAGEVGRVDHLGAEGAPRRAAQLHESIRTRLWPLSPDTVVLPGHVSGSLCGATLVSDPQTTIGAELGRSPAGSPGSLDTFIRHVLDDQPELPRAWEAIREINRQGPEEMDLASSPQAMEPAELIRFLGRDGVMLDVRLTPDYNAGHIENCLHIGLDGQMELWLSILVPPGTPIGLIAPPGRLEEVWIRMARVGYERPVAALKGGFEAWKAASLPVRTAGALSVEEAEVHLREHPEVQFLDVRRPSEWREFRAPGAQLIPLCDLAGRTGEMDPGRPLAIVCRAGYRSSIAASLFERAGVNVPFLNVTGGMTAWRAAALPLVCPGESKS